MADQLKISQAPVKMPSITRQEPQSEVPFQIQDVSKINTLNVRKEEHGQNLGLLNHENAVLSELLKQSELSTQYIFAYHNIESVVQMLSIDNAGLQEALGKLLASFALEPTQLVQEMKTQAQHNVTFYGNVFDELRSLLKQGHKSLVIDALHAMLVPITHARARASIQAHLEALMHKYGQTSVYEHIKQVFEMSAQLDAQTLQEELTKLFSSLDKQGLLDEGVKTTFRLFEVHLSRLLRIDQDEFDFKTQALYQNAIAENLRSGSKTMGKFVELLKLAEQNSSDVDKQSLQDILRFILNAPSNYIPLHHIYLPLRFHEQIVHAEAWIDTGNEQKTTQVLLVVDLNEIGMLECEIHAVDKRLSIVLSVPSEYRSVFELQRDSMALAIRKLGYGVDKIKIDDWLQSRSLLDVFPHLQALQTGVDTYA